MIFNLIEKKEKEVDKKNKKRFDKCSRRNKKTSVLTKVKWIIKVKENKKCQIKISINLWLKDQLGNKI